MDRYDPAQVYSSIDRNGRYAYANQPAIGQWNLTRLAESLLPLMPGEFDTNADLARAELARYLREYEQRFQGVMLAKLGLGEGGTELITPWLELLEQTRTDWTWAHLP